MAPMEDRQLVVLALCGLGVELYVCIFRKRVMEIVDESFRRGDFRMPPP